MTRRTYIEGDDLKRKNQGVQALWREEEARGAEAAADIPRTKSEKAKAQAKLQKELFKTMGDAQKRAFRAARNAVDTDFLKRLVASELIELKRRVADGEAEGGYRTDAALARLVDQLRRLDAIGYADEQLLPDRVTITFERPADLPDEDVSDQPEFE